MKRTKKDEPPKEFDVEEIIGFLMESEQLKFRIKWLG
jgi:hypothetical protein